MPVSVVKKLKTIFKDIFKQVVLLLADEGLLTLKEVFYRWG
ncbi:hypothetical protein JBKA6_0154 [Ichthyobacterium seriolicida]|uniref:Uncharacterized protein n=1 Tax=Ichthyobacterium seriolicida TaxID=242600 RepID=A0A1J1DWC3_9FLAO|nr:hypothetical protein JBKA6_0154 [Ichthyobacterium seriolicida]